MPEYLAPGVFIEEIPARLKAIEGVSTSTAGFVGLSERGPEAGFNPFAAPANPPRPDFKFTLDPTPVLVTSFSEYMRQFGLPAADPANRGYLGHAAQAFFNNGGKRLFVGRVCASDAVAAAVRIDTGAILRLTKQPKAGDLVLFVNTLRGLRTAGAPDLNFRRVADGVSVKTVDIASFDQQAQSITLTAALTAGEAAALDPAQVYGEIAGITLTAGNGPRFIARNRGLWGGKLRVQVNCSDRPAVKVAAAAAASTIVQVASTSSFYRGAVVQVGLAATNDTRVVLDVLPGNQLRLNTAVTVATTDFLRVLEIDVVLFDLGSGTTEVFRGLGWHASSDPDVRRRHYSSVINARSRLAWCQPAWGGLDPTAAVAEDNPDLTNQPMTTHGDQMQPTTLGGDGTTTLSAIEPQIVGADGGPGARTGIQSLQDVDDIRIIAAPGFTSVTVQNELIIQCERMRYRFAVLDGEEAPAGGAVTAILKHRNAYDTSFAAYYTPWLQVGDGDRTVNLPPAGFMAGIYARTDNQRGVWKAPANEVVLGITGMTAYITTGEQEVLNPRGVNAIRRFEGRGIRVWGARTLSSDPEFKYINVRRFLIFLEASLDRGTQWVVFEPNAPETWSRVTDSVSAFLLTQWRSGALFGRRPEDAFFVRCDETTMTADDVQNGRLICNIGVAIVRPAEFVIFRIEQITGFAKK